ncbi:MAG: hypothetical protein [Olavius algarvensis spirochete endosymbiont]|nr:MAG: hypothetical protein [Olavius algarvensis spirochete endosymbiont]
MQRLCIGVLTLSNSLQARSFALSEIGPKQSTRHLQRFSSVDGRIVSLKDFIRRALDLLMAKSLLLSTSLHGKRKRIVILDMSMVLVIHMHMIGIGRRYPPGNLVDRCYQKSDDEKKHEVFGLIELKVPLVVLLTILANWEEFSLFNGFDEIYCFLEKPKALSP